MRRLGGRLARILTLVVASMVASGTAPAFGQDRDPVAATPHFAFYSDLATNLNDVLIQVGRARDDEDGPLASGTPATCFDELTPSARVGWSLAVDYYRQIVSPVAWHQDPRSLLRRHLAGLGEEPEEPRERQLVEIAGAMRSAATPAYRACLWSRQDERNRRWIEARVDQLATHGKAIAERLQELYRRPWGALPIPVDVVETAGWSGANSYILDPAGGHLLVSSESYGGLEALEIVFHEASHLLFRRGAPVPKALAEAADASGVPLPDDLWHVVLFHTTGETVRRVLEEAGEPGYVPMLQEIYERSDWARFRDALESAWTPYLDGDRSLEEAAADLIRTLPEEEGA